MISELKIRDAFVGHRNVEVFIDGTLVDTLHITGTLSEGMELDSDAINEALQGRRVIDIFFTGEVVNVITEEE